MKRLFHRLLPKTPASDPKKKLVWRISADQPQGAWVDPSPPARLRAEPAPRLDAPTSSGWLTSSMDLLGGAEIVEFQHTVPVDPEVEHKG